MSSIGFIDSGIADGAVRVQAQCAYIFRALWCQWMFVESKAGWKGMEQEGYGQCAYVA